MNEKQYIQLVKTNFQKIVLNEMKKKKLSYRDLSKMMGKDIEYSGNLYRILKHKSNIPELTTIYKIFCALKISNKLNSIFKVK